MNNDETRNDLPLVRRLPSAVEKAKPSAKRILAGMVADVLAAVNRVDLDALVLEGKRIQRREGMTPEDIRAFEHFYRAAVAGHGEAQLLVYESYLGGHGVSEDLEKALEWFHKSAESGFVIAQRQLGVFYQDTQVHDIAVQWYRKAAEQGDAVAQWSLGLCYMDGEGVIQDYAEAVKWTRKAAEQGDAIAQKNLGVFYDRGQGVPQNFTEAVKWYRKAAEQGLAGAQNDLGVCYETGQGVPQNLHEAANWYRKAAEGGDSNAPSNLQRLSGCLELKNQQEIVFAFIDFLAAKSPPLGDCSKLPSPKKSILHAIQSLSNHYGEVMEASDDPQLQESAEKMLPKLNYLLTCLTRDWHDIDQEDKDAVAKLASLDSFPEWALPLKLKYINEEKASEEACEAFLEVMEEGILSRKTEPIESLTPKPTERERASHRLARKLGLPIGYEVEVWLKNEIRMTGKLELDESVLLLETIDERRFRLVIGETRFCYDDLESCVRMD